MNKLSTYYAVTGINLGSIFPQSSTLQALKPAPLQPIKLLAYIISNFLVLLLSQFITIYYHYIFTQDLQLLLKEYHL